MSYCRWSSDNGYCDVYVYEDVHGGWTTHVAGRRRPPGAPTDPLSVFDLGVDLDPSDQMAEYKRRQADWREWADANPPVDIDHALAGKSFNDPSPGACADRLEHLRYEGFVVPQYAIDALREEETE